MWQIFNEDCDHVETTVILENVIMWRVKKGDLHGERCEEEK